jgi:cardiolipin synthase
LIDGALARWRNEQTFLGALIDPLADKVLLLSIFFTLAFVQSPLFGVPHWLVWLMLTKEMVQVVGFVMIYMINGTVQIQPRLLGKLTTMAQMIFVVWLFACYFFDWVPLRTYYVALGILVTLVFASFIQYAYIGITWVLNRRST